MYLVVSRTAFGAWAGAFCAYVGLTVAGMADEARHVLGLMFLLSGVQLGALAYGRRHGEDGTR